MQAPQSTKSGMTVRGPHVSGASDIFTPAALQFLYELHAEFQARQHEIIAARKVRQTLIAHGTRPEFEEQTADIRDDASWTVAGHRGAPGLERRIVELTSPVTPRDAAAALNSDADIWLADLEDSLSPTWHNIVTAHVCLRRAARGQYAFQSRSGSTYSVRNPHPPTMMVRPRGWHLPEAHLAWTDSRGKEQAASAALVDVGLFVFHSAQALLDRGSGPYLYLPKLESAREARLWSEVFVFAQERLGFATGTIRASILIESVTAAFQMEEILFELRDHAVGLTAGRWDYVASAIRSFGAYADCILPDRVELSAQLPFMRAFTALLIDTCHRRGAQAIGGMSTDIFTHAEEPTAQAPESWESAAEEAAMRRVSEDKIREARQGFDGTWVAHPSLIDPVREAFVQVMGDRHEQLDGISGTSVSAADLRPTGPGARSVRPTEEAVRTQIRACLLYFNAWLFGRGRECVGHRVEDSSTAELARVLLWQWVAHGVRLADGTTLTAKALTRMVAEELAVIPRSNFDHFDDAEEMLLCSVLAESCPEYFTAKAYSRHLADSWAPRELPRAESRVSHTLLSVRAA